MAEESDLEKTEEASTRRLEKAREEGDVPRSKELATFTVLIAAAMGLWFSGEAVIRQIKSMLANALYFNEINQADGAIINNTMLLDLFTLMLSLLPFIGLVMLSALLSPAFIGGWLFSNKAIMPNFGKLNPIKGLSNMISKNALVELIKSILKTLLVGYVAWLVIMSQMDAIFALASESLTVASSHQGHILLICFTFMVLALALIAFIDAPYQMYHYAEKLKMTRQDLRDEAKESEGNPETKAKVRSIQRQMASRRMMSQIPTADVVVTNPTHYAVALKYPENANYAPLIVAKGMGEIAIKIKEVALEHKIVLMEAPPLARALYHHTELGDEIPKQLYTAVSQVLAYVFQLRDWHKNGGLEPLKPDHIDVPTDFDHLSTSSNQS
jgi:flagellar biosynthetic protein FlhB